MHRNRETAAELVFEDDLALGEWIHKWLIEAFGLETEAWAVERVREAERQLQVKRAPRARLTAELLWLQEANAFTVPGRYIYISRELLQRASSTDPVAFALAHEMARHDLGHLDPLAGRRALLSHLPAGANIALLVQVANHLLIGPEAEQAADRYAIDLCLRAGFDGNKCVDLFDIVESEALNFGDVDIVFGTEDSLNDSVQGVRRWAAQARKWGWERYRGYLPIRDRKEAILRRIAESA